MRQLLGRLLRVKDLSGFSPKVTGTVSFDVYSGDIIHLNGVSGIGKTSLFRALLQDHPRQAFLHGKLVIARDDILGRESEFDFCDRRAIALVRSTFVVATQFAQLNFSPLDSIYSQIRYCFFNTWCSNSKLGGHLSQQDFLVKFKDLCDKFLLDFRLSFSYPNQLSGGQIQRFGLINLLMRRSRIFLFDEPLSNLDRDLSGSVFDILIDQVRLSGGAMLIIAHESGSFSSSVSQVIHLGSLGIDYVRTPERLGDYYGRLASCDKGGGSLASLGAVASQEAAPLVTLENVSKVYRSSFYFGKFGKRGKLVLDGVSLSIREREKVIFVGDSGTGKSTLLRIMAGIDRDISGNIFYSDAIGSRLQRQFLFQDIKNNFNPHRTIYESMLELIGSLEVELRVDAELRLKEIMSKLGLSSDNLQSYPDMLSGGEIQRFAICRCLLAKPKILFADEPTSAIDVSLIYDFVDILSEMHEVFGMSLVFATHNIDLARRLADVVYKLESGGIYRY